MGENYGGNIAKNYLFNTLYKLVNICMPLITAPYLSRVVGAEALGTYSYYYAIAHYFYLVGKMGLNNYGTRQVATQKGEAERDHVFSSIFTQQILTALSMAAVYAVFCLSQAGENSLIPLILGLYVIGCLFDVDWLWCGLEKFDKIAVKNIFVKFVSLIGIFLFVKDEEDLWIYTFVMSFSMLAGFLTLWIGLRKYVTFRRVAFKDALSHLKPNLILMLPVLASNIYRSMDKVLVGQMSSMTELGYYDNAEKIIYAISGLITAFTNVMMPRCSHFVAAEQEDKCRKYIGNTFHFLFFLIGGMAFGCFALADRIVILFYGSDFESSILLLQILSAALLPMIWGEIIRSMWVIPHRMDQVFLTSICTGAMINLAINLLLIPTYGAAGASAATVAAELSVLAVQFLFLHRELRYGDFLRNVAPYLLAGVLMVITLKMLNVYFANSVINLLILILIGGGCYLGFVFVLLLITNYRLWAELIGSLSKRSKG